MALTGLLRLAFIVTLDPADELWVATPVAQN